MGTRSQTQVIQTYTDDNTGKPVEEVVCSMYRQFDGYFEGHGKELAEFLAPGVLGNGISLSDDAPKIFFNGAGCLAAQMVAHFKDGAGGIYLEPTNYEGQGWNYKIYAPWGGGELRVEVEAYDEIIFKGTPQEMLEFEMPEVE